VWGCGGAGEARGGRSEEKEKERRRESLLKERVPRGESCTVFGFLMCSLFWCVILVTETVNRPLDVSPQKISFGYSNGGGDVRRTSGMLENTKK
jgi:hypothetical protein